MSTPFVVGQSEIGDTDVIGSTGTTASQDGAPFIIGQSVVGDTDVIGGTAGIGIGIVRLNDATVTGSDLLSSAIVASLISSVGLVASDLLADGIVVRP